MWCCGWVRHSNAGTMSEKVCLLLIRTVHSDLVWRTKTIGRYTKLPEYILAISSRHRQRLSYVPIALGFGKSAWSCSVSVLCPFCVGRLRTPQIMDGSSEHVRTHRLSKVDRHRKSHLTLNSAGSWCETKNQQWETGRLEIISLGWVS